MQGDTLISSMSGRRLVEGEGGEGEGSAGSLPSKFGRFSRINDLGLVGSGDIRLQQMTLEMNLDWNITYSCCELFVRESANSLSGSAEGVSCSSTPRDG